MTVCQWLFCPQTLILLPKSGTTTVADSQICPKLDEAVLPLHSKKWYIFQPRRLTAMGPKSEGRYWWNPLNLSYKWMTCYNLHPVISRRCWSKSVTLRQTPVYWELSGWSRSVNTGDSWFAPPHLHHRCCIKGMILSLRIFLCGFYSL